MTRMQPTRRGRLVPLLLLAVSLIACRGREKPRASAPRSSVAQPDPTPGKTASTPGSGPVGEALCNQPVGLEKGRLVRDSRWCGDILVLQSVLVPRGVTLTIAPGTLIRFKHYRGYREPHKRLRLRVEGKLVARGTPEAVIRFTSDAEDRRNGDWSMLALVEAAGSELAYTVIEFGQHGLNIWKTDLDLDHVVIRFHNWEGLYAENNARVTLKSSRVYNNGYNCVAVEQYVKLKVTGSYIANCGTVGIHLDASEATVEGSLLEGSQEGISLDNDAKVTIRGNRFTAQKNGAISCGGGDNQVLLGPNEYDGYLVDNAVSCPEPSIKDIEGSEAQPPVDLVTGVQEGQSAYLDYIPGFRPLDPYPYEFPEADETRKVISRLGGNIGLTWSAAWDGQHLWTANLDGEVMQMDPKTGAVLKRFPSPGPQPWGLAFDGQFLWIVDFARRQIAAVSPEDGKVRLKFPSPDPAGGCKGLAYDGKHLYALGWATHELYQLAPDGKILSRVPAPWQQQGSVRVYAAGGLAWDGEAFWAPAERLLRFDRKGKLLGWIHSTSERVWDMAWDGEALWTTQRANENWVDFPRLFRVKVLAVQPP